MKIQKLANKLRKIAKKYRISYAILFGSIAEKRFIPKESDVDIGIKVKNLKKEKTFRFLKSFVRDLDIENVDVTIINFSPFSLAFDILTKGKVIYCKDEDELFEDRLKIVKLHHDWVHMSKIYEKREIEKVMERKQAPLKD